jgi:hypothetical protein
MRADPYAGAAERWAGGASLIYRPIVTRLIGVYPDPLDGHLVFDAGTGVATAS